MTGAPAHRPTIIGLTGLPCVGKGVVKDCLIEWCAQRGWRAMHLSFSDEIRHEARACGLNAADLDRDRLHTLVADMRAREGPAVLADRIIRRICAAPAPERADVYVVEAIRHPTEVAHLRTAFGAAFLLVAVTADFDRIIAWMNARRRGDESRAALQSRDVALALLQKELNGGPDVSVNVGACIAQADHVLANDGTLEELRRRTIALAERIFGAGEEWRRDERRNSNCARGARC